MKGAQSVLRALGILEVFTSGPESWSVRELSDELGITLPTAHRMVRALVERGFLAPDVRRRGGYTVGPSVLRLAETVLVPTDERDLYTLAVPHLEELRALTDETVGLHRRAGVHRIAVAELESRQPVRLSLGTGRTRPIYTGAVGKVFMAYMTEPELKRVLEHASSTDGLTQAECRDVRQEVKAVAKQGVATSVESWTPGAAAMAAPVRDSSGSVLAVMSVSGPAERWTLEAMQRFEPSLLRIVEGIQRELAGETALA